MLWVGVGWVWNDIGKICKEVNRGCEEIFFCKCMIAYVVSRNSNCIKNAKRDGMC